MILWVSSSGRARLGWPATAPCGASGSHKHSWSVNRLMGGWLTLDGFMHMSQSWWGLLAGTPHFYSMWPFPRASAGFLFRPHEIKESENGNCKTHCGLAWKSCHVTWIAFYWPKQVTKLAQNQEVGKRPLSFDKRSCKESEGLFNPPGVGTPCFLDKGPRSPLVIESLQLCRCNLLTNHWVQVEHYCEWSQCLMKTSKSENAKMRVLNGAMKSTVKAALQMAAQSCQWKTGVESTGGTSKLLRLVGSRAWAKYLSPVRSPHSPPHPQSCPLQHSLMQFRVIQWKQAFGFGIL